MAKSIKQETLSSVKWSAIEKYSVQVVQFLLGIIMARLLTPADFGTIGMIGIFFAISNTFIDSGLNSALIRKLDRTDVDFATMFWFNLAVSILCYIVLFLVSPWVAVFFKMPVLKDILRLQSVTLIVNAFATVQSTRLTIALNFRAIAKINLSSSVFSGIAGVCFAYFGCGVWAIVYQTILYSIFNTIALNVYNRWLPKREFSRKSFKEMFGFGSKLLASGLLNTVYANLTPLAIGKFYKPSDLGFYDRGTKLAALPVSNINGVLSKVTYPIMSQLQNDDKHLIRVYRKYIITTSMCIFFCCTLLAALGKPLVTLIYSAKWSACVIFLQIYAFAIMFDHISSINLNLLQVKGRSDLSLKLEIIKKTISTLILFASIPFGVLAICISKIIYSQIAVFINTYYTGKLFGLGYVTQIKDFSKYFFLSVLTCLPTFILCELLPYWFVTIPIGLVFSCCAYAFLLRKDQYALEIWEIVRARMRKK